MLKFALLFAATLVTVNAADAMCVDNVTNIQMNADKAQKLVADFTKNKEFVSTTREFASCSIEVSPSPQVMNGVFMVTIEERRLGVLLDSASAPVAVGVSGTGDCATGAPYTITSTTDNVPRQLSVDFGANPDGPKSPSISITRYSAKGRSKIECVPKN